MAGAGELEGVTLRPSLVWGGGRLDPSAVVQLLRGPSDADGLRLRVRAPLKGDPPPPGPAGHRPRLWEHEVVELFLAGSGPGYLELELGPHGHHLVLRLADVRVEGGVERELSLHTAKGDGWWSAEAHLPPSWLPAGPLRGLACHVFGDAPRVYAVSAPLPGAEPDFHQPADFPVLAWERVPAAHTSPGSPK